MSGQFLEALVLADLHLGQGGDAAVLLGDDRLPRGYLAFQGDPLVSRAFCSALR